MMQENGVASPCTNACNIGTQWPWCSGCGRSLNEITEWPDAKPERKRDILAMLAPRLAMMCGN